MSSSCCVEEARSDRCCGAEAAWLSLTDAGPHLQGGVDQLELIQVVLAQAN